MIIKLIALNKLIVVCKLQFLEFLRRHALQHNPQKTTCQRVHQVKILPKNKPLIKIKAIVEIEPTNMDQSSPQKLILVNRDPNGIATVTINRPDSLNSLTRAMNVDLAQAFKSLDRDEAVRVIILTGSGRSFCSGVDLTAAEDIFKGDVKDPESDPVVQMERCRKPIIGAIRGFAVTAGFEIALACDIVVAVKGSKFMDTHARFLSSFVVLYLN